MTTTHDIQRDRIALACRNGAVALAAGVVAGVWASTTAPRVLFGDRDGFVGNLHRGRLPAVEIFSESEDWQRETASGGSTFPIWVLRVHVPNMGQQAAEALAREIGLTCLAVIRADAFLSEGKGTPEAIGKLVPTPLGMALEIRASFAFTFDRDDYTTGAIPIPPEGTVGGYTFLIDKNTPAGSGIVFGMAVGQAIDNIEISVEEAWDVPATLTIGDALDADRFFLTTDSDLSGVVDYEKAFADLGPISIRYTLALTGVPAAGRLRVQISVTTAGT